MSSMDMIPQEVIDSIIEARAPLRVTGPPSPPPKDLKNGASHHVMQIRDVQFTVNVGDLEDEANRPSPGQGIEEAVTRAMTQALVRDAAATLFSGSQGGVTPHRTTVGVGHGTVTTRKPSGPPPNLRAAMFDDLPDLSHIRPAGESLRGMHLDYDANMVPSPRTMVPDTGVGVVTLGTFPDISWDDTVDEMHEWHEPDPWGSFSLPRSPSLNPRVYGRPLTPERRSLSLDPTINMVFNVGDVVTINGGRFAVDSIEGGSVNLRPLGVGDVVDTKYKHPTTNARRRIDIGGHGGEEEAG